MKIELKQPHKAIYSLDSAELPEFAILIGRNGAGKTQLLNSLKDGTATISGIGRDEIELFDMVSFNPPNADRPRVKPNRTLAQATAEAYLLSNPSGEALIDTAAAIFDKHVADNERANGVQSTQDFVSSLRDEIKHLPDAAVFAMDGPQSPYKKELYEQVMLPLIPEQHRNRDDESLRSARKASNVNQAMLLSAAMKKSGKLPHELTHEDVLRASDSRGESLSNEVGQVFAAYKFSQYEWAHKRIETEHIEFSRLITEYRTKYPPPWMTLRRILSDMRDAAGEPGLFDFEFSDPDDHELRMSNYSEFSFNAKMINRTNEISYELDSLSSGEKILMALCLVSFNQYLGRRPPKLLLLDELDAVLHPSMAKALVVTMKDLFVRQGTRVLMTSHSPMTVAAVDETDIFRVARTGGDVKISRTTKSEAVNELSEGLATIDVGLRIAASDEAKVTILTEGNNTKHLKRWVELNFPDEVLVFEGLEHNTSDTQLLAYGRLLGKMDTSTHFVVVWDCDATQKAATLRNELQTGSKVRAYAFPKRHDNAIATKGIENNYDEEILKPYSNTTTRNNDGTFVSLSFPNESKTEFADHVMKQGTPDYFSNFNELHDLVSGILHPTGKKLARNMPQS